MVSSLDTPTSLTEALDLMASDLPPLNPGSAITPQNIKRRRKELQLTQKELGGLTGVSERAVGAWERAEHTPEGKVRERVAEVLGLEYTPAKRRGDDAVVELELIRTQLKYLRDGIATIESLVDRALGA
jgi:transcriptional regulator with XRE-family HTH domain